MRRDLAFKAWRLLPDRVRIPLDIRRRCPLWRAAGVIFIHVPKAAGVSVSRALYGRPLGHFSASDVRRVCPQLFAALPSLGVVRHPVSRLHSAYRFARAGGTAEMGMKNPGLYRTEVFDTFDRFVREWLAVQDVSRLDGIFRPQHLYLCEGDRVLVDKIIRLEEIDQGMRELAALLGRPLALGHHNRSQARTATVDSAETLALIARIYQKDFELFSYPVGPRP